MEDVVQIDRIVDAEGSRQLAAWLAPRLRPGDTVLLGGDVGAGKTHFARALIQARLARAGRIEDVPSPTFTLVQTYDDGLAEIWHTDLYRLTDAQELIELGLEDALRGAICLVEWPDRLGSPWPDSALRIDFLPAADPDLRHLRLTGAASRWSGLTPDDQ